MNSFSTRLNFYSQKSKQLLNFIAASHNFKLNCLQAPPPPPAAATNTGISCKMSLIPCTSHILLICFITITLLVQSRFTLHPSHHNTHSHINKHFHVQNPPETNNETKSIIPKRYIFAENSQGQNQSNRKKLVDWILEFLAGALSGAGSGLIFSLLIKIIMFIMRRRKKGSSWKIYSTMIRKRDVAFLENENGLASLDIIGRGGNGAIYKAVLSNGKEIAIKKINQYPRNPDELGHEDNKFLNRKMRQIMSEIETIGRIKHRNLLPLLAHLVRPGYHYLVYEYMKNGSLQDNLRYGETELDWLARYKIALGVAEGLEYLHMNHNPSIIHRDLTPANILLDDEMEARISDFGLAKAVSDAQTHVTTSNVAGTVGYIAPEYYQTFKFTQKCDVYSFGVVLGVLVSGKLPYDELFREMDGMSLVKWLRNLMTSEDPRRAIDSKMLGNGYEDEMLLVLKVACFCTLEDPKERPNSREVRSLLSQIKHN